MTKHSAPYDDQHLRLLNKGTFGEVYHRPNHSTVYKQVFDAYGDSNLLAEFNQ